MEASIFHGTLPFIMDNPAISRGGRGMLDSFKARLLCRADWENDARLLGFEIDRKLAVFGYYSLWVKSMEPDEQAEEVVVVEISGEGLFNVGDRRQRTMKCGEKEFSVGPFEKVAIVWSKEERGENPKTGEKLEKVPRRQALLDDDGEPQLKDIATPSGTGKRWVVSEAEVCVIDTYFVTAKPAMNVSGTPITPPNPPDVPPYQWGGYDEAMRGRHPNGWVLADRGSEEVFRYNDLDGLWRVTDTHVYRQPSAPD